MDAPAPDVSVVLPVFNEVSSLRPLLDEIRAALDPTGRPYEILFCDDGSTDGSPQMLRELAEKDPRVKVVALVRNFGQTAALDAGFQAARGRIVVPMDADLQNDPADIPRLLARLEQDADAVSGWRVNRRDAYWTKTLPSRLANHLVSWTTGVDLHDYGCTLKAYRAEVLKEFRLYGEMHRLIPAYVAWAGGRVVEMPVNHRERRFGTSKYNLSKTLRLLLDLMTVRFLLSYSTKPLYFMGKWGFLTAGLGMATFLWVLVKKAWWGEPLYTDPFFLVSVFLLLAGGQFLLTGLLAELSMRTYFETRGRSPWRVRWAVNLGDAFPTPPAEDASRRAPAPSPAPGSQAPSGPRPTAAQPIVAFGRPAREPGTPTPPPAPRPEALATTSRHPRSGFALPPAAGSAPAPAAPAAAAEAGPSTPPRDAPATPPAGPRDAPAAAAPPLEVDLPSLEALADDLEALGGPQPPPQAPGPARVAAAPESTPAAPEAPAAPPAAAPRPVAPPAAPSPPGPAPVEPPRRTTSAFVPPRAPSGATPAPAEGPQRRATSAFVPPAAAPASPPAGPTAPSPAAAPPPGWAPRKPSAALPRPAAPGAPEAPGPAGDPGQPPPGGRQ